MPTASYIRNPQVIPGGGGGQVRTPCTLPLGILPWLFIINFLKQKRNAAQIDVFQIIDTNRVANRETAEML